mmetsp:Transcript_20922/g.30648  ORF Transcript_20922/g.30648 Transcript_20922/m.30648 type:complete len:130 (+) Transcript_20922:148-537(+)
MHVLDPDCSQRFGTFVGSKGAAERIGPRASAGNCDNSLISRLQPREEVRFVVSVGTIDAREGALYVLYGCDRVSVVSTTVTNPLGIMNGMRRMVRKGNKCRFGCTSKWRDDEQFRHKASIIVAECCSVA